MNIPQTNESEPGLVTLATAQGIKAYTEGGRIKMESSRPADIIRLWASIGADVTTTHDSNTVKSWRIDMGGAYVACILHDKAQSPEFTYCYTTAA